MYGHPEKPDAWDSQDSDPSGFTVGCTVIALPVFVIAFALGYMAGVWGWV